MDANATPYDLRLSEADWDLEASGEGLEWDGEGSSVTLTREQFRFPRPGANRDLRPTDRRGAARDRYGHWFFIGPGRRDIRLVRAGERQSVRYWPVETPPSEPVGDFAPLVPPPAPEPVALSGLAVTEHHHLVVGVPSLPGLLLFDLHGGGPPVELRWPFAFAPVDMAPAPGDGLWVLDHPPGGPAARLWRLDHDFRVHDLGGAGAPPAPVEDFGPSPLPAQPCAERIERGFALPFDLRPDVVEGLPDDSVLLLEGTRILRVRRSGEPVPFAFDAGQLRGAPHDIAFLPAGDGVAGRLFAVDTEGNQAYAFLLSADGTELTPTLEYFPLRLFAGRGLVRAGDAVYFDSGERWLALVDRRTPRYGVEGSVLLHGFDSARPDCVWHRLLLDACLPAGTSVSVQSRAGDTPELLAAAEWVDEPAPYLRGDGSELPAAPRPRAERPPGSGTWELLLQRATGRHLQLRLRVTGNGRRTPRLFALRVYRPRFSYLREYLPDVFAQDPVSASFLDRYLANPEGIFTAIEDRVATAQRHYDVRTVDGDYLPWLASWLGVVLEADWEDERRRLFIDHLPELFRLRGTRAGLLLMIRLAIDACPSAALFDAACDCGCGGGATAAFTPRIVESFLTRRVPAVALGDPSELDGPREVDSGERWTPAEGAAALHERWNAFLVARHGPQPAPARFPPLPPADPVDWRRFVREALAIPYEEPGSADVESWRRFLTSRYRRPEELAAAWGRAAVTAFADIALPAELPEQGAELLDWIQFVSIVLATERRAHRFTVLVPVRPEDSDEDRARRLSRVERVVLVERPVHTDYDIKPYWAACRVGEARVGLDTVIGEGSRFVAVVLGRDRLATGYLSVRPPGDVPDRLVVGRDRVRPDRGERP
ncbi:phage tail protein [Solirubrobacter ginsenosidimutans]|uniref:Phage tail protein n=1 Tax=Solirubrobacter ginsenosidimutans TaxID=490573 RepID=A0A9X3N083_9ACTN|nr:phage tail protein [Solirubrobacter ginsenosidimutans]MDA0166266.1 phage tail protein [Solirubrobacter ginsenosidimutans]